MQGVPDLLQADSRDPVQTGYQDGPMYRLYGDLHATLYDLYLPVTENPLHDLSTGLQDGNL